MWTRKTFAKLLQIIHLFIPNQQIGRCEIPNKIYKSDNMKNVDVKTTPSEFYLAS